MPELPDITIYIEALERRVVGHTLIALDVHTPFLLRTVDPPLQSVGGATVRTLRRMGKRIAFELDDELFVVIHLMIAGRFKWTHGIARPARNRNVLATFVFDSGTLTLTEAGTKKRASLHIVRGVDALRQFERGGLEPLAITEAQFTERLRSENHTIKRSLTDPRLFSGIGNAYSDEILHRARLSPVKLTSRMTDEEMSRVFTATQDVLREWVERMRREVGDGFPEKVTAFRPEMAVHGKYGKPCPLCGTAVQRIRYADNETNYCPRCQTDGKLLADRGLSRLLKQDWPRRIEELEA
ncbi:MAG TPA: DNA-formamidopyrimidine glycosylase family protein [Gemmatimonadaceae bacterium]|nr:DNA-formamidopyrimidine glycosylase family protein [Gemmatimonadaceae bacterium]